MTGTWSFEWGKWEIVPPFLGGAVFFSFFLKNFCTFTFPSVSSIKYSFILQVQISSYFTHEYRRHIGLQLSIHHHLSPSLRENGGRTRAWFWWNRSSKDPRSQHWPITIKIGAIPGIYSTYSGHSFDIHFSNRDGSCQGAGDGHRIRKFRPDDGYFHWLDQVYVLLHLRVWPSPSKHTHAHIYIYRFM